jgi:hypothetical protein
MRFCSLSSHLKSALVYFLSSQAEKKKKVEENDIEMFVTVCQVTWRRAQQQETQYS